MEKPALTIIIPAYNATATLTRCIESLLCQDYKFWQAIIVDDGSTDNTLSIAQQLSTQDSRIFVVHKDNGGLSDARNYALDIITENNKNQIEASYKQGVSQPHQHDSLLFTLHSSLLNNYLTFLDSDDYLEQGTLKALMEEIAQHPEYDILEYPALIHAGSKREHTLSLSGNTYSDAKDYWLREEAYRHTYAWNKIYKASIFANGIRYPKGKIFEDAWILPEILKQKPLIATTNRGLYIYTDNPKGITSTADKDFEALSQLLAAQINALSLLGIDLTAPSLTKEEARLYLTLRNQETTLKRLNSAFISPLPHRRIPLKAARSLREVIKILAFYK